MLRYNMAEHFKAIGSSIEIMLLMLQTAMETMNQVTRTREDYLSVIPHMQGSGKYIAPNTVNADGLNALVKTMCNHLFANDQEKQSQIVQAQYGTPQKLAEAVDEFVQGSRMGNVFGSRITGPHQFEDIATCAMAGVTMPSAIVDASSKGSDHDADAQANARFDIMRPAQPAGAKTASGVYHRSHSNSSSAIHLV